MRSCSPGSRRIGKAAVMCLLLPLVVLVWDFLGEWSIWGAGRITEVTGIHFPASTRVLWGRDTRLGSITFLNAVLEMDRADFPAFKRQDRMGTFETPAP